MILMFLAAQVVAQNAQPAQNQPSTTTYAVLGPMNGQDIMAIAYIVLMQSAKDANEDLKSIMQDIARMNRDKAGVRDLLQAMKQEQARLRGSPELAQQQHGWAVSLTSLCPPGASRDECLIRQLRLRTAALRGQSAIRHR